MKKRLGLITLLSALTCLPAKALATEGLPVRARAEESKNWLGLERTSLTGTVYPGQDDHNLDIKGVFAVKITPLPEASLVLGYSPQFIAQNGSSQRKLLRLSYEYHRLDAELRLRFWENENFLTQIGARHFSGHAIDRDQAAGPEINTAWLGVKYNFGSRFIESNKLNHLFAQIHFPIGFKETDYRTPFVFGLRINDDILDLPLYGETGVEISAIERIDFQRAAFAEIGLRPLKYLEVFVGLSAGNTALSILTGAIPNTNGTGVLNFGLRILWDKM